MSETRARFTPFAASRITIVIRSPATKAWVCWNKVCPEVWRMVMVWKPSVTVMYTDTVAKVEPERTFRLSMNTSSVDPFVVAFRKRTWLVRPEDGNVGTGNGKFGQKPQSPGSGATGGVLVAMGVVGIPAMSSPGRGATGGVLVAMGVVGMPEISGQVGMQPAQA